MTASDEFWNETLSTLARLDDMSYYDVLGVEPGAGGVSLSEAYYAMVRKMHPDRHCRETNPTRQKALVRIYARMTEAYRVLSDSDKRQAYDASLRVGKTRLSPAQLSPKRRLGQRRDPSTERARKLYERGRSLLDARQHAAARAQLELALAYEPDSEAIRSALARVIEPVRAHARYPVERHVSVRCETWEQLEELYTSDLSRGGMFIKTADPIDVGTPLSLELTTPDNRKVILKAEVRRWVPPDHAADTGPGVGVRFLELTKKKRAEISEIIEAQRAAKIEASLEMLEPEPEPEPDFELPDEISEDSDAPGATEAAPDVANRSPSAGPPPIPSLLAEDDLFDEKSFVGLAIAGEEELAVEHVAGARDGASALRQGQYEVAKEMFSRALQKRPDDRKLRSNYYLACGQVERAAGRMQEARVSFERALKYDNSCHDAAYELRKLRQR